MKAAGLFTFASLMAPCSLQANQSPDLPAVADPSSFQRSVRAGVATLDAMSRLFAAIEARHQAKVSAVDRSRLVFSDVAPADRAYAALSALQQHNSVLGYPDGFFSGKRILTRYEFAVAVKRALDANLRSIVPEGDAPAPRTSPRADILLVSALAEEFDFELRALGVNMREVRRLLSISLSK